MGLVFGTRQLGRYELIDHIASGGMGKIFLARVTGLGGFERRVVLKTLECPRDERHRLVSMFLDEARIGGALHHPHIAAVYEVGYEAGRYFLVMEHVDGYTAETVLHESDRRGTPIPLGFALAVVSAVASALHYAHELRAVDGTPVRIVHRDVSLSNMMIDHHGTVKLIDFGVARSSDREATTLGKSRLKGTIAYLSPEQILNEPIDRRTDIFALGIALYELTTTRRAFADVSDLRTMQRITSGEIEPPSAIVPGYPRELERIVMRALAVEPARRYQDAGAMARELEQVAAWLGIPLGHAPIVDRISSLFGDSTGHRRRVARGSSPPVGVPANPDEETTALRVVIDFNEVTEMTPPVEPALPAQTSQRDDDTEVAGPETVSRHELVIESD